MAMTTQDIEDSKKVISLYHLREFYKKIDKLYGDGSSAKTSTSGTEEDSVSTEDLMLHTLDSDGTTKLSFVYNSAVTYTYQGDFTTMKTYDADLDEDEVYETSFAVFKVSDLDTYIRYTINDDTDTEDITYTYEGTYTSSSEEAADFVGLFDIGKYALVTQLAGTTGDKFLANKSATFIDANGKALRHRYVNGADYTSAGLESDKKYLLAVNDEYAFQYVYKSDGYYKKNRNGNANGTEGLKAIYKTIKAIVEAGGTYDSNVTYPDGSVGHELSSLALKIGKKADGRTVLDASEVDVDELDSTKHAIAIDGDTTDEVLDWRGQETQLNVYCDELCRNEVTIYFDGANAANIVGDSTRSIGDISVTSGYQYCMVIQDDVYIVAPLSRNSASATSE